MFKGNNILKLNEATLIAAVEEYLNARIVKGEDELKVLSVRESNGNTSYDRSFEVGTTNDQQQVVK